MKFSFVALAAAAFAGIAKASLPTISVDGRYFYFENGTRFFIKGVAYQPNVDTDSNGDAVSSDFVDPLAQEDSCLRDVEYFKKLHINTIRVYAVNASQDHSACMKALDSAGIYVLADLAQPSESIDRTSPKWDTNLFSRYASVVDAMANYTNVLGFFAGNEVTNNNTNTPASAFVKAAVRDMKSYISMQGYRSIPVGYSTNDDSDTRVSMADYFECGSTDERADFYGVNIYEWCGSSTYQESGYADRTEEFANFTIPVFFSEFGCITKRPRTFQEVQALFGVNMTGVWSGGIAYQYFETNNNYGVVSIESSSVVTLTDFPYLASQFGAVTPTTSSDVSTTTVTASCLPTNTNWVAAVELPPTPSDEICQCMSNSRSCVVLDSVSSSSYTDLFNYVCGVVSCDGITANGTYPGSYGDYSFCDSKQMLNFVLDLYYSAKGDCDFSGSATTTKTSALSGTCASYVSAAGSVGTNSVAYSMDANAVATTLTTPGASATNGTSTSSVKSGSTTYSSSGSSGSVGSSAVTLSGNAIYAFMATVIAGVAVAFL
ncbi:cell wall protein Gas1 [Schizosaccharomyces japonicus yFS275]|uniref:1,3-beta-glucanosyltransferase n=1 Tax=Schizosaccharomyces japonicus (strain yFS275 / FY16936) TaxID=402676 RepID=B6K097_SCHJY|nr:cell wall protein Gas1 [Schizosaccharomyces japonicus yFS275]EEB06247.1 cell wall protein Gas1 [Schizosaccharomyces japonicus yFS275]